MKFLTTANGLNNSQIKKGEFKKSMRTLKTTSNRSNSANKVIKKLVSEHPEYEEICDYLCMYPLQKWASNVRKSVNIDIYSLNQAITNNGEYFGIKNLYDGSMSYQKLSLKLTDEMITFFEDMFNDESLDKTQKSIIENLFLNSKKTIRAKEITSKFEETLLMLFEKYNDEFLKYLDDMVDINIELGSEISILYHNTEGLFNFATCLKNSKKGKYKFNDVDEEIVCRVIQNTIDCLTKYPFLDNVNIIMQRKYEGWNNSKIGKEELAKFKHGHNEYVTRRYEEGIEALHSIFWGYTNTRGYTIE